MYEIELIETSQAYALLAFAISVTGPEFPALLGVSVRNKNEVIDLSTFNVTQQGTVICLLENPQYLGFTDNRLIYKGGITFALWENDTFEKQLARINWTKWEYGHITLNPNLQLNGMVIDQIKEKFETMRNKYKNSPFWTAKKV